MSLGRRGYEVMLAEATNELGGRVTLEARLPGLAAWIRVVDYRLGQLERLLQRAPDWLLPGGILAIISFHSLEDRRVKQAFLADERLERITRKPLVAEAAEAEANPRSRSAKLRLARRRG